MDKLRVLDVGESESADDAQVAALELERIKSDTVYIKNFQKFGQNQSFATSDKMTIEMNFHNASKPLNNLIQKVEHFLIDTDHYGQGSSQPKGSGRRQHQLAVRKGPLNVKSTVNPVSQSQAIPVKRDSMPLKRGSMKRTTRPEAVSQTSTDALSVHSRA